MITPKKKPRDGKLTNTEQAENKKFPKHVRLLKAVRMASS